MSTWPSRSASILVSSCPRSSPEACCTGRWPWSPANLNADTREVLAHGSPVVKKGSGLMCCHRWILLFGERHAWCLSICFSHHRKVDGQRLGYKVLLRLYGLFAATPIHGNVIFCVLFYASAALLAKCYSAYLQQFTFSSSLQALSDGMGWSSPFGTGCGSRCPLWLMCSRGL